MIALRALAALLVALTMVALLALSLLGTPGGSAWVVGTLTDLSGDRLAISGARGTLLGGMEVDRLQIAAGRTTIVIEPALVRMSWPDLLRRRVRLVTARADSVRVDIAPRPPGAPDSVVEPLELPVVIAADSLEIGQVIVRNGVMEDAADAPDIVPVVIGPLYFKGGLAGGELRVESLDAVFSDVRLRATGSFGTGEPFPVQAELRWTAPEEMAVWGEGSLSGDLARLRFEQVVRLPTPVGVGGVAQLLVEEPAVYAEARWTGLRRPLGQPDDGDSALLIASDAGQLSVRGWTSGYTAELAATGRIGASPEVRLQAKAAGDTRELRIPDLYVAALSGRIDGSGTITFPEGASRVSGTSPDKAEKVSGTLRIRGEGLDPGALDSRFKGLVNFASEIRFDDSGNFRVTVPEADGTLFDRPLRASGTVARDGDVLSFDEVRVSAGVNRLELSGSQAATGKGGSGISGRFRIDAPDLATLLPPFRGELRGSGEVGGTTDKPTLKVDLAGAALATGDIAVRNLKVTGGVGARDRLAIDLVATGLRYSGTDLGNLSAGVDGAVAAHDATLVLEGGEVEAQLHASGAWRSGVLTETLHSARVELAGTRPWTLRDAATVNYSAPEVSVSPHCWIAGDAELCVADSRSGAGRLDGGVELHRFPLDNLAPWLPADIGLGGVANAELSVQQAGESLAGALHATLSGAVITWRIPDDDDVRTEINEFRLAARLADDTLDFDAAVAESYGLRLGASGRVLRPLGDAPMIDAQLSGGIPDLASIAPLLERVADAGDLKGRLTLDAQLTGNARQPDITGGLELEDGEFTVAVAGVRVDRIALALTGRPDGQLALSGNARSGKGYVALDGAIQWRDRLLPEARATIRGRVFDVINLPEGRVQVSPDVHVVFTDGQFRVGGEMLVPRAAIQLKKVGEGAVSPSPDTVVHGRDLVTEEKPPPLFVIDDLAVRLGENVTFEGFGLKTGLTGGLRLSQSLEADPTVVTGDGVVSLKDGQFSAFGQKLEIERGSLLFSGVVTDPGLDVKASRDLTWEGRDVTVGVMLSGSLSRIQTRVYSEPAMGELDALSYLTTGKPLSAAGAGDRSSVTNAAIGLGLNQALPVVQQLGSALNVDEVGLDTTAGGETAVVVGEQLGKNLFIRYSYGIFDKLGTVQATYKLGRRLSIEGSSGEEQALDLIYSVNW